VDRLLTEGHNPAHFARQMVRFLRNATVAKVAGADSPLLQISSDERARVDRVADQFSEEDLTRFLQLMLRTHGELGYKQEQRFHLELGLLKLVHAQRLLPLEQILSEAQSNTGSAAAGATRVGEPGTRVGEPRHTTASRPQPGGPSPFETDRARKSAAPPDWDPSRTPKAVAVTSPAAGSPRSETTAPGIQESSPGSAVAVASPEISPEELQAQVIEAMERANSRTPIVEVSAEGTELVIKVGMAQTLVDAGLALSEEARRGAVATAGRLVGRPVKLRVVGVAGGKQAASVAARPANGPGARSRAADDPVVRRVQEKFGAQIRTVIDHKEKR
jgi:DNA polymerase-3 subunit gamma/tau